MNKYILTFILMAFILIICGCSNSNSEGTSSNDSIIEDTVGDEGEEAEYKYFRVCDGITNEFKGGKSRSFPDDVINAEREEYMYIYYYIDVDDEVDIETVKAIMSEIFEIEKGDLDISLNPGIYLWDNKDRALSNIPPDIAMWPDDRERTLSTIIYNNSEFLPGTLYHAAWTKEPEVFKFEYYGYNNYDNSEVGFNSHWIEFVNCEYIKVQVTN